MISHYSSMKALSQPSQPSAGQYQRPPNLANNAKYVQISLMPTSPLYGPPLSNSRQRPHSSSNASLKQQAFQPQVQHPQSLSRLSQQSVQQPHQFHQVGQQNSFQKQPSLPQLQSNQQYQFQQIPQQFFQAAPQQQQYLQPMDRGSSASLFSSSQSLQPRVFQPAPQQQQQPQQSQPRYQILQLKGVNIRQTTNEAHNTTLPSIPVALSPQANIPIKQLKYEDGFRRQRFSEQIQQNQVFDQQQQQFQSPAQKSRSNSLPQTEPTELLAMSQVRMVPVRLQDGFASPQIQAYAPHENDEGRQLLAELTSIHHALNRSMEEYQLAFSSKRMTSTEISKHKSQFRQRIQETHMNCSKLIQHYPRIFPQQQPKTPNGQQQLSLSRAIPGSTYYEREINHLIDIIDEAHHQYMIVPHKISSQSTLPVGLQKTDEDVTSQNIQYLQKQEQPSNDQNSSIASIGLYSPIVKAFPNIHHLESLHQQPPQQLNITAFTQNNYIQNNFQHESLDFPKKSAPTLQSDLAAKQEFSAVGNHAKPTPFNESIPPYATYFTTAGQQDLNGIKNYTTDIESKDYLTNDFEGKKYAFTTVDDYLNNLASPLKDYAAKDYTYMTDYGIKQTEGSNSIPLNGQTYTKLTTTPNPPSAPVSIQNYFSGDSYLKKDSFSTNQFGIEDYKPLTLREKDGVSSVANAKNSLGDTQQKQLQQQLQEKTLREEAQSLEKFEQKLDNQVCEYSYEMLSEMDRKIIEIKCTIQHALEQADMPMTKQLLIEVLDSLASTANTADQSLAVKAIQKIHDNATRLHSDNSTSYNLYIYLQKISNFLKSRANILELSTQAHELSLLNQTNASFWQPDYMDRQQNTENYQVKKEQQGNHSFNNPINLASNATFLPAEGLKVTQFVQKDTNDVPNYVPMKIGAANYEPASIPIGQTSAFNYLPQDKQELMPSHYSPLTLKRPEESITSSISQQPIVLEQLHAQESSLSNQIRLHTADPYKGLGISSQDSSRRVSMLQQRQPDNESKSSNSQMLYSVPFVIQNDYLLSGGNMEQSGRGRIQSYAITNQISELNQAKQVAAQASAQEELLAAAQVPANISGIHSYSYKLQSNVGSVGNQLSFAKAGVSSTPLQQDPISTDFTQGTSKNASNPYQLSPVFSQDKAATSVPLTHNNYYQNPSQAKERLNIDTNDDINNLPSYQYSSSRPPARTRVTSSEANTLNAQSQKTNQLRNHEVTLALTTEQSAQKQEQPTQLAGGHLNAPWQNDLSFAGNSNQNSATSPSAFQITHGASALPSTQKLQSIGTFDISREIPKQMNQYISEENKPQAIASQESNSNLPKLKMKFFDTAVGLKEHFPRNHPAHYVLISQLWETARGIPETNWEQFILSQFNSVK